MPTGLSFGLIHLRPPPFTSVRGPPVRAGHGRRRTVVNSGAQYSKACEGASLPWVQIPPPPPLTCINTGPDGRQAHASGRPGLIYWSQLRAAYGPAARISRRCCAWSRTRRTTLNGSERQGARRPSVRPAVHGWPGPSATGRIPANLRTASHGVIEEFWRNARTSAEVLGVVVRSWGSIAWPRPDGRSVPRPRGWLPRVLREETAPESGVGAGQLTAGLALILGWLAECRLVKPLGRAWAHVIPARLPGSAAGWVIAGAWLPGLRFHSPLRGAAVGDENWVPPVAGGVRAGGGWGLCLVLQAAGGVEGALWCWCAVRRHRERVDRLWPRLRLVLEPLAG